MIDHKINILKQGGERVPNSNLSPKELSAIKIRQINNYLKKKRKKHFDINFKRYKKMEEALIIRSF